MKLETNRLIIRPFLPTDYEAVYDYMSDPKTTYFLPEGVMSESDVKTFITHNTKAFAIYLKEGTQLVGHIEFYPWFGEHTYEIGWAINPHYQGQGIAHEAAHQTLKYGFESLGIHRVIATANLRMSPLSV
ncbi:GNAT family N-acetyltransferase [Vibrio mexicanus]|uniref:GNAT family N-acetyltransferase n=1 Tax=Vibrio mexicanus TaxID=1004326 RepID=UPI000B0AB0C1|nr:GNAT family N-acetyltransferase [Vibrio mexicanus]